MEKEFHIKNMVCDRCIKVLREAMDAADIHLKHIDLGRIVIHSDNFILDQSKLEHILHANGFSIINNPNEQFVQEIKYLLIKLIQDLPLNMTKNLSLLLSEKLHRDYSHISKIFSSVEQMTIEKFFIKLKIEKAKELLQSQRYNFTEISQLLDYTNINHLSSQFKNVTGMSLSTYKALKINLRKPLDKI